MDAPRVGMGGDVRWERQLRRIVQGAEFAALGLLPVLVTISQLHSLVVQHVLAVDYSQGPWVAGERLFAGLSPYVGAQSAQVGGIAFVYPAVAALVLAPFSLLARGAAGGVFTVLDIAAILITLWVLSVRDWRVYGACLLWPAVLSGWETANLTLLLALGVAVVWRRRDAPLLVGALIALLISVKLFVWPLALWLIATRRYRASGYAAAAGLAMNLLAWGVLGFDQITRYRELIAALAGAQQNRGYSLMALLLNGGVHRPLALVLTTGLTLLFAGACLLAGRRRGSQAALAICVAMCLIATPISWLHYFALFVVPLAIARPRLSVLWLVPILFDFPTVGPDTREILIMFGVGAAICLIAARPRGEWAVRNPPAQPLLPTGRARWPERSDATAWSRSSRPRPLLPGWRTPPHGPRMSRDPRDRRPHRRPPGERRRSA